jgi:hypothetical protein
VTCDAKASGANQLANGLRLEDSLSPFRIELGFVSAKWQRNLVPQQQVLFQTGPNQRLLQDILLHLMLERFFRHADPERRDLIEL